MNDCKSIEPCLPFSHTIRSISESNIHVAENLDQIVGIIIMPPLAVGALDAHQHPVLVEPRQREDLRFRVVRFGHENKLDA